MKFSKKFLAYAVMIALGLSVMIYGVYAATNVSLYLYGQLSFAPHDCEGTAQILSVTGALNQNGTKYTLAESDANQVINWQDSDALLLSNPIYLDDISTRDSSGKYFDENVKIAPIVITLRMTNTSKFKINTIAKVNTQLTTAEETPSNINGLTYSYSEIVLEKVNQEGSSVDTFKITITPDSTVITSPIVITSFVLSVELMRYVAV